MVIDPVVGVAAVAVAVIDFPVVAVGVGIESGAVVQHESGDRGLHRLKQSFHAFGGLVGMRAVRSFQLLRSHRLGGAMTNSGRDDIIPCSFSAIWLRPGQ